MTKRELIEALEALECNDETEVEALHSFCFTDLKGDDCQVMVQAIQYNEATKTIVLE